MNYMNPMYFNPPIVSSATPISANQAVSGQIETMNYFERSGAILLVVIAGITVTYVTKMYYSYQKLHSALSKESRKLNPEIQAWYALTLLNIMFLILVLITYTFSKKHLVISYILLLMGLTGLGSVLISLVIYVQVLPTMKNIEPKLVPIFKQDLIYELALGSLVAFIGLSTWFFTYNCDCVDVRYKKDESILSQRMRHSNLDSEITPDQTVQPQSKSNSKKHNVFKLF